LPPVVVVGKSESSSPGESSLEQEVLRRLPVGNGSLNELLRFFPGLQLSQDFNSSRNSGEILPPAFSISGGKVYQNNFLVDGIANNNIIDPASTQGDNVVTDVPGHPQERFLNRELLDKLSVYDSNVPARFGGFAGGVVEATTRNPGPEIEGHLSYRTTRDQWTRYHLAETEQGGATDGGPPRFSKNEYGATLAFPLREEMGILTSWHQLDSRIPRPYFRGTKIQHRRQQSYFLKYVLEAAADDRFEFILSSTPYREDNFLANVANSDYVVKMEGLALQGEWQHFFPGSEVRMQTAYRRSSNLRRGPQDFRTWAATDSKDWGRQVGSEFSAEGGFGTIEKIQESFDVKGLLRRDAFRIGTVGHELTAGIDFNRTLGSFERQGTTYVYKGAQLSPNIICAANDFACVENEQFFTTRTLYPAAKSQAVINQLGLHGEDVVRYRRLELRPGLRLDYNDLMEQANLAPRFVAGYDLFGSGATLLQVGANRYYGTTLLTDKLREAKAPFSAESRTAFNNRPTAWTSASNQGPNVTRFTRLQTPYADELSVGVEQKMAGGILALQYLRREGHDEFARDYSPLQADGLRYYTLNNRGRSQHERVSLAWQRKWTRHTLAWNASWQETTMNNESYDTQLESEEIDSRIWYKDELIFRSDLPDRVKNRPIRVNLIWVADLPARFTFTNISRYRSVHREIARTGEFRQLPAAERRIDPVSGEVILDAVAVYEEIRSPGKVIFDWRLGWSLPVYRRQELNFSLDINNVFNSRIQTGGSATTYEMGRQFWAGVAYDF
jgi:hypothetical protein